MTAARDSLAAAAEVSGFQFNPAKSIGPSTALEVFNLNLSHGHLAVTATRLVMFQAALKVATVEEADGILGYVGTVNSDQRSLLSAGP